MPSGAMMNPVGVSRLRGSASAALVETFRGFHPRRLCAYLIDKLLRQFFDFLAPGRQRLT